MMKTTTRNIERLHEFLKKFYERKFTHFHLLKRSQEYVAKQIILTDLRNGSGKRQRSTNEDDEILPPRKRRRVIIAMPPTFYKKVKKWKERKRRILLGLFLYARAQKQKSEEQTRYNRRLTRKRSSSELFADYEGISKCKYAKKIDTIPTLVSVPVRHGMIKRMVANDTTNVKVAPTQRRKGWRKAGDKRF